MRNNAHNLPERVKHVVDGLNPPRDKPSREVIHVTELLIPANARNLLIENWDDLEQDYSDWLISCQGDAMHEAYKKYLGTQGWHCEIPLQIDFGNVELVGTCDAFNMDERLLVDLKQTAVWSPGYKIEDYTKQTNCYGFMLPTNVGGAYVRKIQIDVWYRNWKLKDSQWDHQYPKIPYETIEIEVWPLAKTEAFIKERIDYLLNYEGECTRADKWQKYSAFRNTNKNPDRNFDTKEEAQKWIDNWTYKDSGLKNPPKVKPTFRLEDTQPTSCLSYCPARSVCPYAKKLKG